jgi:hypothetical protein
MIRAAILFAFATVAEAQFAYFVDDFTVPPATKRTVVVTLHETVAAPVECVKIFPGWQRALMWATLMLPMACAQWPLDGTPTCSIWIHPQDSNLAYGHEIAAHCLTGRDDHHGALGL